MTATLATAPKRPEVFVQGQFAIPNWVEDLDSFRRWRLSDDAPHQGEIAFLDSYIFPAEGLYWVELLNAGAVVARQALSLTS